MLKPAQLADLSWHPLRDVGRSPNYALSLLGQDADGHLRYLMACGHQSVPSHAICERGCPEAPNYRQPYVHHEDWRLAAKRMDRYGVEDVDTLDRLPKDLQPPGGRLWFYRENEVRPRQVA